MAVRIRLRRIGKNPKKKPHFRITVFDKRRNRDGKFIEEIGFYNPISKLSKVNKERFDYWVSKGAEVSLRVKNIVDKSHEITEKEGKDVTTVNTD
jgi:small subunit ribosomal protein S16